MVSGDPAGDDGNDSDSDFADQSLKLPAFGAPHLNLPNGDADEDNTQSVLQTRPLSPSFG